MRVGNRFSAELKQKYLDVIEKAAYVTGRDYLRRTIIANDFACMGASSPLFCATIAWQDFIPDSGWQTHQAWLFNPERMIGMIIVEAAHEDRAPAKAVRLYMRLGGTGCDVVEKDGIFSRDELKVRIVQHTLDSCSLEPAYTF